LGYAARNKGGRPKGSVNRYTGALKELILQAAEEVGDCREIKQWLTREEAIAELKALGLDEGTVRAWLSRIALNPKVSVEFLLFFRAHLFPVPGRSSHAPLPVARRSCAGVSGSG
jgi:hypothetical protein